MITEQSLYLSALSCLIKKMKNLEPVAKELGEKDFNEHQELLKFAESEFEKWRALKQ